VNKSPKTTSCPVALTPGFMLDETLWSAFRKHLPTDWLTLDAPLYGGQTIPEMARYIADNLPQRFVLIGFSLGGYIARQVAADYPERVKALILVASSLREDTEEQRKTKLQAVQALTPDRFRGLSNSAIARSLHPDRASDTALVDYIKEMSRRLGYKTLATQSALDRAEVPASTIQCPTLVIASTNDALRSREEADELVEAIPDAALKVIEDSGHMIPLEQPRELAETIVHWLATLTVR